MTYRKTYTLFLICIAYTTAWAQGFHFEEGLIGKIRPQGWLREALHRQQEGLTGHPEALSYPYNTCLWAGYIPRIVQQFDSEWWRYEQTAYYTDGLLRLGYLTGDRQLIQKGEEGIAYTLEHVQPGGRLGDYRLESLWPMAVFFRAMKAQYEYYPQPDIVKALEKHYLSLSQQDLVEGHRHILNLEGMLWTYGQTHNRTLLERAEAAFGCGGFPLDSKQIATEDSICMHGVNYSEQLKLPILLYAYTGKKEYLQLARKAHRQLEEKQMLPDGLPTSAEYTLGYDIDIAHETCNVTDYTWTLGYFLATTGEAIWADRIERTIFNAGMGSVTKDFKALQYFSSVNQIIATGSSDNNEFKRGSTWMAYRPTHETECCAGNVSRFMPNFTSRLWMRHTSAATGKKGIAATLYAPSQISLETDGANVSIVEDTYYPFDGEIRFYFTTTRPVSFPFTYRIPNWCDDYTLLLNGKRLPSEAKKGTFATLERTFQTGDVLTLRLTMKPRVVEALGHQGRYVECGPLLFSYAIPEHWEEDSEVHANLNGKASQNPDFKCWNITPAGPWGYAMPALKGKAHLTSCMDGWQEARQRALKLNVDRQLLQSGAYPFDLKDNPLSITLPVEEIEWPLLDGKRNPDTPMGRDVRPTGQKTRVKLVPYGCTQLRLTVFPER